jgi:hypothetical protein
VGQLVANMALSQTLRGVWVNIVDLMNARRTGTKVKRFPSAEALRAYTRGKKSRVFSKNEAKRNGFLKVLLITVFGGGPGR